MISKIDNLELIYGGKKRAPACSWSEAAKEGGSGLLMGLATGSPLNAAIGGAASASFCGLRNINN